MSLIDVSVNIKCKYRQLTLIRGLVTYAPDAVHCLVLDQACPTTE